MRAPFIVLAVCPVLAGCLVTDVAVGTVSTVGSVAVGTVSLAAGTVVAVGSTAVGAAGSVAGAALNSGAGASAVAAGTTLAGAQALGRIPSQDMLLEEQLAEGSLRSQSTQTAEAATAPPPPIEVLDEGLVSCLQAMSTTDLLSANLISKGWAVGLDEASSETNTPEDRRRSLTRGAVSGTVLPGSGCSFTTGDIVVAQAKTLAQKIIKTTFEGEYTLGRPNNEVPECGAYSFEIGAVRGWMSFGDGDANPGCAGQGASVTVTVAS